MRPELAERRMRRTVSGGEIVRMANDFDLGITLAMIRDAVRTGKLRELEPDSLRFDTDAANAWMTAVAREHGVFE